MMQTAFQSCTRLLAAILAGVTGTTLATAAAAAGLNLGAGATVSAPGAAQAGGSAEAHLSANGNAQWKSGATRGVDRALEREGTSVGGAEAAAAAGFETDGQAAAEARRPVTR